MQKRSFDIFTFRTSYNDNNLCTASRVSHKEQLSIACNHVYLIAVCCSFFLPASRCELDPTTWCRDYFPVIELFKSFTLHICNIGNRKCEIYYINLTSNIYYIIFNISRISLSFKPLCYSLTMYPIASLKSTNIDTFATQFI